MKVFSLYCSDSGEHLDTCKALDEAGAADWFADTWELEGCEIVEDVRDD